MAGADHGYNTTAFGTREQTEPVHELIADHVRRAVG
ncbi:hypothetical protein HNR68_002795 [Saccharopolyspora hordei]|uniref:Uncharacterized protein n=1 Tax=Saccharopolyspora hordei TaxID=1838 RepID=A0A853AJ74_9PSEU|nr:hypothetical protein [Saccharopolyspora hordei]